MMINNISKNNVTSQT